MDEITTIIKLISAFVDMLNKIIDTINKRK